MHKWTPDQLAFLAANSSVSGTELTAGFRNTFRTVGNTLSDKAIINRRFWVTTQGPRLAARKTAPAPALVVKSVKPVKAPKVATIQHAPKVASTNYVAERPDNCTCCGGLITNGGAPKLFGEFWCHTCDRQTKQSKALSANLAKLTPSHNTKSSRAELDQSHEVKSQILAALRQKPKRKSIDIELGSWKARIDRHAGGSFPALGGLLTPKDRKEVALLFGC